MFGNLLRGAAVVTAIAVFTSHPALGVVATFDDLPLSAESYWNGTDESGSFTTGGVTLPNSYNASWYSWEGWAYSNSTDATTPGWANQYSAIAGGGVDGSAGYGVAYLSAFSGSLSQVDIALANTGTADRCGFYVTNTAYAYYSMRDGDPYGFSKKFGGTTGNDADYFKVTITGLGSDNQPISAAPVDFYLADFRSENNANDYIVNDWRFVDVSSLKVGGAAKLGFSFASSDNGYYGINTPTYFAIDQAPLALRTWNGGTGGNWNDPLNWSGGALPTVKGRPDNLAFQGGAQTSVQVTTNDFENLTVGGVTFAANTGSLRLEGAGLTVAGTIDNRAAAKQQIDLPITFAGGGVLHVEQPFDATAATGLLTISGQVRGAGGITKTGAGKAELTAASNEYTGDTKVKEGILQVDAGIDSNGQWATHADSTTVGTAATTAELITAHVRQDSLTINAGSKVAIQSTGNAGTTSVVNFLNIANALGSFDWSDGGSQSLAIAGGATSAAAVPEPAAWLLLTAGAVLAGVIRRRTKPTT